MYPSFYFEQIIAWTNPAWWAESCFSKRAVAHTNCLMKSEVIQPIKNFALRSPIAANISWQLFFLTSSYGWYTGKNWPNFLPGRKIGRQWTTWLKQRKTRQFFACKTALSSERPANRHKDQLTTVQGNWTSFDNLNQGKTNHFFLLANCSLFWKTNKPHKDQLTTVQGNWTSSDNLNQGTTDQIFLLANWSELWEPHKPRNDQLMTAPPPDKEHLPAGWLT